MTNKAAVMPASDFKDMCKDIACEWLSEVWTEYPYIRDGAGEYFALRPVDDKGDPVYTIEAQERYDEILDMVEQLAFNYIIVETQEEI